MIENSLEYYLKPLKPKLNSCKLLSKQQSPKREITHTISCRINPQIITQQLTEPINQKSFQTLPLRQPISQNVNRFYILRHKKPNDGKFNLKNRNITLKSNSQKLRRLMTRQKKSSSLGKRVKFFQ